MSIEKDYNRQIETQSAEFDALAELIKAFNALPPVVDDDYPEMRHYYENRMHSFIDALNANGRFGDKQPVTDKNTNPATLTFARLRTVNLSRCERWHDITSWSLSDWAVAAAGEMGELCNVVKKLNRVRDGMIGNKETPAQLTQMLAEEIADVLIYLDLLSASLDLDLAALIKYKFNVVSERNGFPERLE